MWIMWIDGQDIEPFTYVPVLPMLLVNGSNGIGTGWSTSIPNYNPLDIIANLRLLLLKMSTGESTVNMLSIHDVHKMTPWYNGFSGTVEVVDQKETKVLFLFSLLSLFYLSFISFISLLFY